MLGDSGCHFFEIVGIFSAGDLRGLGVELDLDELPGFFGRRFPLPVADGVMSGLRKNRMAASNLDGLHGAIRRDYCFHFHAPLYLHIARDWGILWSDPIHDFAITFRGFLCATEAEGENTQNSSECCGSHPPGSFHSDEHKLLLPLAEDNLGNFTSSV
jgi:hypothetical protein